MPLLPPNQPLNVDITRIFLKFDFGTIETRPERDGIRVEHFHVSYKRDDPATAVGIQISRIGRPPCLVLLFSKIFAKQPVHRLKTAHQSSSKTPCIRACFNVRNRPNSQTRTSLRFSRINNAALHLRPSLFSTEKSPRS